jgi:hypothetical protein
LEGGQQSEQSVLASSAQPQLPIFGHEMKSISDRLCITIGSVKTGAMVFPTNSSAILRPCMRHTSMQNAGETKHKPIVPSAAEQAALENSELTLTTCQFAPPLPLSATAVAARTTTARARQLLAGAGDRAQRRVVMGLSSPEPSCARSRANYPNDYIVQQVSRARVPSAAWTGRTTRGPSREPWNKKNKLGSAPHTTAV